MIKAVIFDIDNTLYNFREAHRPAMREVLAYGRQHFQMDNDRLMEVYKRAWRLAEQRIASDTAATHNRMIRFQCMMELMGQPLFPHVGKMYSLYWETLLEHSKPSPGLLPLLAALKEKKVRIGVGTDMTAQIQYRKLEKLGVAPYIDMVVTSEEAGVEKPDAKFFTLCVEKAGCEAAECAFIGDHLEKDVGGSIASGLCGIWYSQGEQPEQQQPFPVIVSFEDVTGTPIESLFHK